MGFQCKNFWSNQVFAPHDRSERVQGIQNPLFLRNGTAKSKNEALRMCQDICWKNPGCEGFNFENGFYGCYFLNGFEKLMRYQKIFLPDLFVLFKFSLFIEKKCRDGTQFTVSLWDQFLYTCDELFVT